MPKKDNDSSNLSIHQVICTLTWNPHFAGRGYDILSRVNIYSFRYKPILNIFLKFHFNIDNIHVSNKITARG